MGKLLSQTSDVVSWPNACVGCGSLGDGQMQAFPFQFRADRPGVGVRYYVRVGVNTLVCSKCIKEARRRFKNIVAKRIALFLPFLLIMILTANGFTSLMKSINPSLEYEFVPPSNLFEEMLIYIGGLIFPFAAIIGLTASVSILDMSFDSLIPRNAF